MVVRPILVVFSPLSEIRHQRGYMSKNAPKIVRLLILPWVSVALLGGTYHLP